MHSYAMGPAGTAKRVTVTASGPSGATPVALDGWSNQGGGSVLVNNLGAADVFILWGGPGIVCTKSSGHACLARAPTIYSVPDSATHLWLVSETGSVEVSISQGQGL